MKKNTIKKLIYAVLLLLIILAVIIKAQTIKSKNLEEKLSIKSEWTKYGKPVDIIKIDKKLLEYHLKVSGVLIGQTIYAFIPDITRNQMYTGQKFCIEKSKSCGKIKDISQNFDEISGLYKVRLKLFKKSRIKQKSIVIAYVKTLLKKNKSLLLPIKSIFKEDNKSKCWVVINNIAKKRVISIGRINDFFAEITSGLKLGDQVVTNGLNSLKPGDLVKIHKIEGAE